jgi:two-component system chemotaxis response regulator CheB
LELGRATYAKKQGAQAQWPMTFLVVIGASAGGVHALLRLAEALPRNFPAPVCVVQHVGNHPSLLPELLSFRGDLPAVHPTEGELLRAGTIYVAPPDHHVLVEGPRLKVTHGPRENHSRPAIDPLFRSAAATWGARVIGVVLTGQLDDGAAGLKTVKECGGITIVQDPASAAQPEMPLAALAATTVDHCVTLEELAPLLQRLVATRAPAEGTPAPEHVATELAIMQGDDRVDTLATIADPSTLTCPDCSGTLWEVRDRKPLRYRCHTGHAFTAGTLAHAQQEGAEGALWSAVRALRERALLHRRLASIAAATGEAEQAAAGERQAARLDQQVQELRAMAQAEDEVREEAGAAQ